MTHGEGVRTIRLSDAGWSSLAARRAHNPKVTGSNPVPATSFKGIVSCSTRPRAVQAVLRIQSPHRPKRCGLLRFCLCRLPY
ncbi:hypothetical protein BCAR13_980003 [Paraburkholderia caribensis]|nr:hypothetical protein BCAR13_980003 [Paraburkholderia caribensis]